MENCFNVNPGASLSPRPGGGDLCLPQWESSDSRRAFRLVLCLIAALLITTAQAQVMSLDSVLSHVSRHPMLQEYDHNAQAMQAYSEGATAWMAPMVGVGTFMTPYPGTKVDEMMGDRDKGSIMISVEQTIPNTARLNAKKDYLAARATIEQHGRANQFNALRAEARELYYSWIVDEKKIAVLQENEQILKLLLKLARIRYPYNQGSLGAIYEAESKYQEVQNQLLTTQGDIAEKSYRLKALMNLPATAPLAVDTTLTIAFTPASTPDTTVLSAQRNDLRQLNSSIEAIRLNQRYQRLQARPDFKLRFDHMEPLGRDMPRQFTAMAMVSIPIAPWSSRMYTAEARGMQYEIQALQRSREARLLDARGMLGGLGARLTNLQQQRERYRTRILPALRHNYDTRMLAYEENLEQLPMVVDSWEAWNMARLEYLEKTAEYYSLLVRYEKELDQ
ncbi:TolC family protein [Fulvivirgaceae bacterium PWU5]|uniref:TolC family protein n=1 Tax=Dawidia cretensis TaxID=2782350 RepID=A0AAP2E285_9BACT|nr:TolC family protein [Dawidia cretensis]MBT1711711.1 TolC family protein [Dawidia cretensis]